MPYSKNASPCGWYIASYLLRFIEIDDGDNEELKKRFHCWENTILVNAQDIGLAYEKAVKFAQRECRPYKGGPNGVKVRWKFEGLTELLPIYEELEDGSEIMWAKHAPSQLKNIRKRVRKKEEFML